MKYIFWLFFGLTVGCSTVPPTNVHQPMTARPSPRFEIGKWQWRNLSGHFGRPLFEDRRARFVGDTITIKITESTTASAKSNNKLDRAGSNSKRSISGLTGG
jgi:flagellar L-ring protein precursor FlgH